MLQLQRAAGNHAVAGVLRTVQRVPFDASTSETLYNKADAATGQAEAAPFSVSGRYDMTRQGDTGVTVLVRIRFMSQARNTVPPPQNAPAGTPRLGQLIGPRTEIPDGDSRRGKAEEMAQRAVALWNGRLTLVSEGTGGTTKRLPVTFQAEAKFEADAPDCHAEVTMHPASSVGGSSGHPIDAGNFYETRDEAVYPASEDMIYAHEYGHLLGIPDEYSQSNAQMNALLHQAAPANAASAQATLDRAAVERMTFTALANPLVAQLRTAMPQVTDALRSRKAQVRARMASAARGGVVTPEVREALTETLSDSAEGAVAPRVPEVVAFETTRNFSNVSVAAAGVDQGFAANALSAQISAAYAEVLRGHQTGTVAVEGLGDVNVRSAESVYSLAAPGTPLAGDAAGVAEQQVGAAGAPGLPAVAPSGTLVGQLAALPATWGAAGSLLESAVTSDRLAATMRDVIRQSREAAAALPAGADRLTNARQLYQRAYRLMTNSAQEAARQLAVDLIAEAVQPVLESSANALETTVRDEVGKVLNASPSSLAADAPDPRMAAVVNSMKARLDAAKAATAGTGRDPLHNREVAPDQDVTYSYRGLMGTNSTAALRADQFRTMVNNFNTTFLATGEPSFRAEVG